MSRLSSLLAGALLLLGFAAPAGASVRTLTGGLDGDSNSLISMEVVVENGRPTTVENVKVFDADYSCNDPGVTGEKSAGLGDKRIRRDRTATRETYFFRIRTRVGDVAYDIYGTMRPEARRVSGNLALRFDDPVGGPCTGSGIYRAR